MQDMVNTYPLMEIFPGELSSEKTEWLLLRGIKKESLFYFPLFPIDTSSPQCSEENFSYFFYSQNAAIKLFC